MHLSYRVLQQVRIRHLATLGNLVRHHGSQLKKDRAISVLALRQIKSQSTNGFYLRRQFHASSTVNMSSATQLGFYGYKPLDKKGEEYDLAQLQGKVVLVVNVASKCGFTPVRFILLYAVPISLRSM